MSQQENFVFVQSVGIFGDVIASWLLLTTLVSVLFQCRYIAEDEMKDGFSIAPIVLTFFVALLLKIANLSLAINPGITSIRHWLYVIPGVLIVYLINATLLTFANTKDAQFAGILETAEESGGLIQGSEADEDAIVQIIAVMCCAYHWTMWLFMAGTLGTFWLNLREDYKRHSSTEALSQSAA